MRRLILYALHNCDRMTVVSSTLATFSHFSIYHYITVCNLVKNK